MSHHAAYNEQCQKLYSINNSNNYTESVCTEYKVDKYIL